MLDDLIRRQDAIEVLREEWDEAMVAGITASEILSDSEDAINRAPSAQPETNCSEIPNNSDTISRQTVLDILNKCYAEIELDYGRPVNCYEGMFYTRLKMALSTAQSEPAIPLSWIESKIDWLISLDNEFSILTAGQIRAMVNMWKGEQKEGDKE